MACLFLFYFLFYFERKKGIFPVFIFFSPQMAEGACNYPTQVINYGLIEKFVNIFFLLYFIKKIFN